MMTSQTASVRAILEANRSSMLLYHRSGLKPRPVRGIAVVACMDSRLHVEQVMGFRAGDAHIIRNAGGLVTDDALRSLALSTQLLGTREVFIVEHTDCGLLNLQEDLLRQRIAHELHSDTSELRFFSFSDVRQNLRQQVRRVRENQWLPKEISVYGMLFHDKDGRLEQVT